MNRHAHQPSGVLRGDIRDWSTFLFRKDGFSVEEKRTSRLGNLAFDGISVREGLRWHNATIEFKGLAEVGSDKLGTTPQAGLLMQAVRLAGRVAALDVVAETADTSSSSSSSSSSSPFSGTPEKHGGPQAGGGGEHAPVVGDAAASAPTPSTPGGAAAGDKPKLAGYHLVVYYTPISGERLQFICARSDLENATAPFLQGLLRRVIRELRVYVLGVRNKSTTQKNTAILARTHDNNFCAFLRGQPRVGPGEDSRQLGVGVVHVRVRFNVPGVCGVVDCSIQEDVDEARSLRLPVASALGATSRAPATENLDTLQWLNWPMILRRGTPKRPSSM